MVPEHLEFGLLGEHLGHSFSPAIHKQLGGYDYQLVKLPPDQVGPFLQEGNFRGLNVTIPYKKTVMAYCQKLSPAAERIGSVNTIVRKADGSLYGDNTDYDGFRYLLQSAGAQVRGKKVLVLGSEEPPSQCGRCWQTWGLGMWSPSPAAARTTTATWTATGTRSISSMPPRWGCTPTPAYLRWIWTSSPAAKGSLT